MTDLELAQIMQGAGYEVDNDSALTWYYKKNKAFIVYENKQKDLIDLELYITQKGTDSCISYSNYLFKNVSSMNSIEFKKKLEGMTEYAYSLYMDVNRHIDGIAQKLETKAQRLGL